MMTSSSVNGVTHLDMTCGVEGGHLYYQTPCQGLGGLGYLHRYYPNRVVLTDQWIRL